MSLSQMIGIGGLALLAAVGFWLMMTGRKPKPGGEDRGEGPGEGAHDKSSEAFRRAGEDQPGGD